MTPAYIVGMSEKNQKGNKMEILDKRHYFKTARIKGVYLAYVGLKSCVIEKNNAARFLCSMPFGADRWLDENELDEFVL